MPIETTADTKSRIQEAFEANRTKMTSQLARELGVSELEVIQALPPELASELDIEQWEALIRAFESLGNVHVIATNGAVTLECFGQFGNFSTFGEYFNVQTKSIDMHIRHKQLAHVFAVEKQGHLDGVKTLSFQFYDQSGHSAFKVFLSFGGKAPSAERVAAWTGICEQFGKKK